MKSWIIFSLIILSILLVFGIPMIVDWLIIANDIPSNISNSDWVDFLGGYIGAIIGGIVSLIGIGVTIKFTKQQIALSQGQFSEQNRLNNQPILDFEISNILDVEDDETIVMNCEYTLNNNDTFQKAVIEFQVYNIGLGAALDIKYGIELDGALQDGVFWFWKNRSLKSGCSLKQKLMIYCPVQKTFSPDIMVFYDDILGNHYVKRVKVINQQTEQGQQMMCILTQEKGEICDIEIGNNYYVISSIEPTGSFLREEKEESHE